MGAIDLIGCTTKARLYSINITMPARIKVTSRTTKAQTRISISSCVRSRLGWNRWGLDNCFLQYGGYKIIGTVLGELAVRTLASLGRKVLWVLAKVAIAIIASH
jgi:hypothetical protein